MASHAIAVSPCAGDLAILVGGPRKPPRRLLVLAIQAGKAGTLPPKFQKIFDEKHRRPRLA